jgi:alkanesulfonate monooxygenase SsuD/methylene tetrahydromethanopterin reductase-like flavin-dependent oxidoreductase (luciferase family)
MLAVMGNAAVGFPEPAHQFEPLLEDSLVVGERYVERQIFTLIVAPFAAAISYGGLKQVADLYHESCARFGAKPGRLMCSYFTHFADDKAHEDAQRARQIRYYKECVIPAFPGDPKTAPPSYRYFVGMVERLQKVRPEDLTENSVLIGSPARMIDTLKKVEAAGFAEVILYFNVGLKPHGEVKDEMERFMAEVAPAFADARKQHAAA